MAAERDTSRLIAGLAASAEPVRRLRPPPVRALLWLACALLVIGAAVLYHGVRPDFMASMAGPGAWMSWFAAWATGITAAFAAFYLAIPGRSPNWALLPLPLALIWLSGLGLGCYADWVRAGRGGIQLGDSFECFLTIVVMSVLIGAPMALMLRHARLVRPVLTAALGGLAMASLASAGLELFHRGHAVFMDIIWHTVAVLVVVSAMSALGKASAQR